MVFWQSLGRNNADVLHDLRSDRLALVFEWSEFPSSHLGLQLRPILQGVAAAVGGFCVYDVAFGGHDQNEFKLMEADVDALKGNGVTMRLDRMGSDNIEGKSERLLV